MSAREVFGWLSVVGMALWGFYMVASSSQDGPPLWKDAVFLAFWAGICWGLI